MEDIFKNKRKPFSHDGQLPDQQRIPPLQTPCSATENTLLQNILDRLPQLVWVKNTQNRYYYNQAICDYIGSPLNSSPHEACQSFIHPEDYPNFKRLWQNALQIQHGFEQECRIQHHQQGYRVCRICVQPVQDLDHIEWMITATDIHDQALKHRELQQQVLVQGKMLDASIDCIQLLTPQGHLIHMNRSGYLALGIPVHENKSGLPWLNLLPESIQHSGQHAFKQAATGKKSRFDGISIIAGQPPQYWEALLTPILDQEGSTQSIVCVSRNVTQQKIAEKKLQQVVELDELTGLYNRHAFHKLFNKTIQNARHQKESVGFLLIDLDYFKHINDLLGHSAGDYLVQILAQRFNGCFHKKVMVSRLGGDEFAIIVPHLRDEAELLDVAQIARQQLDNPICYAGQYLNGGMSIGCAIYPRDAKNSSTLLRCADVALHDLKISGRGGIRMFNSAMFNNITQTTKQLSLARAIIHHDKIFPVYQPKVKLTDGTVTSFEALLRWQDAEDQTQLPWHIFSAFQDYELATRISEIIQLKVFQDMSQWQEAGLKLLPISINAAPVEFLRDNYAETLLNRLAQFKIPHPLIEIEITEQSLSEHGSDYVIRALNLLKQSGVKISLDDFGTGHSSLTRLRDYPVDCLKIDRNFIKNIPDSSSDLAIVKAICQIGASIALDILVEGIERPEQLEVLKTCDCSTGQGFYFYHPLIFQEATPLLHPVADNAQPFSSSA